MRGFSLFLDVIRAQSATQWSLDPRAPRYPSGDVQDHKKVKFPEESWRALIKECIILSFHKEFIIKIFKIFLKGRAKTLTDSAVDGHAEANAERTQLT